MEAIQTQMCKTPNGWKAETVVDFAEWQILTITTRKNGLSNRLLSTATVSTTLESGLTSYVMCYGFGKGDFSATLLDCSVPRATEKAIRAQHQIALASLDKIKADAVRHYAEQARLAAAEGREATAN
ncbi:MAG: hypothetical protein LBH31_02995 [Burkholderiaceae bacterium]|jgi:hypothetical protein|nr:hypothetical protein [Burkholderiaceae bacterium]